jgi:hypothetical protein
LLAGNACCSGRFISFCPKAGASKSATANFAALPSLIKAIDAVDAAHAPFSSLPG